MLRRLSLLALLFASLASTASTAPAFAAEGDVTWSVRTASNSYGAERANYSFAVNPGGQIHDGIVVTNKGTDALDLTVYAVDGETNASGQLGGQQKDAKQHGLGAWLHADQPTLTLAAGQSVEVPLTIDVPKNATPGEYVGVVFTERSQQGQSTISVDQRLGLKVSLRVGGAVTPKLAVEDVHLAYHGSANPFAKGDATLTYTVHNTGNAIMSARQTAEVAGPFGLARVKAPKLEDVPQLLPGESWKVRVELHGVAPLLLLHANVDVLPVRTDASGTVSGLAAIVEGDHALAVPWPLFVLLVLVAAFATGWVTLRRRTQVRRRAAEEERVKEAVAAALRDREEQTPAP